MKWLTIPEIKRRSKTAKGALKVSYEHWCQLYDATAKELRAEYDRTSGDLTLNLRCGLCVYHTDEKGHRNCKDCVFDPFCPRPVWGNAYRALLRWYLKIEGDWHDWKRACKAVRDKLKSLIKE